MKKAWELSVLCGAEVRTMRSWNALSPILIPYLLQVSVIVFNSAGKLFEFSSVDSVEKAIDRYHAVCSSKRHPVNRV